MEVPTRFQPFAVLPNLETFAGFSLRSALESGRSISTHDMTNANSYT
jgi:hypothetical protein